MAVCYQLKVSVEPSTNRLDCNVTIQNPPEGGFFLNKDLILRQVLADGVGVPFRRDESVSMFGGVDSLVLFEGESPAELQVDYEGCLLPGSMPKIIDVVSMIREDLVELALYAVWYPRFQAGGQFEYQLNADLPVGYQVVTNGCHVHEEITQECRHSVWNSTGQAGDIVLVASKNLKVFNKILEDSQVEIYYDKLPLAYIETMSGQLLGAMQRFNDLYGVLANSRFLRLVYSPRNAWGYARPPAVFVAEEYARSKMSEAFGPADDFHYAAHELAHFWWGIADTNTPDDWINEGLAEFSAYRISEEVFGSECADRRAALYRQHAAASQTETAIVETTADSPDREINRYDKVALLLLAARQRFGEEAIDRFLRTLHARFAGKQSVTTQLFLEELEQQAGAEARAFFSDALYNKNLLEMET